MSGSLAGPSKRPGLALGLALLPRESEAPGPDAPACPRRDVTSARPPEVPAFALGQPCSIPRGFSRGQAWRVGRLPGFAPQQGQPNCPCDATRL